MKQLSIVLNIVLLLAVGFLFYLHFSAVKRFRSGNAGPGAISCPLSKNPMIAFVEWIL
ncbi:MAG: hypothetical protein WDM71_06060 [Ferruginibacter sp.]